MLFLTASPRGKAAMEFKDRPFWLAYTALALGQGASAVFLAAAPNTAANFVAGTSAASGDVLTLRLLASGIGSGAALALALGVRGTTIGVPLFFHMPPFV